MTKGVVYPPPNRLTWKQIETEYIGPESKSLFSGPFLSENRKIPGAEAQRYRACPPTTAKGTSERSFYENRIFVVSWAGHDCQPVPPSAGRDFLSASLPVWLPQTGPWTLAVYLPLAQGCASAAGAQLPPAFQRVCGNLAKQSLSFK